jgi:hypothetical protein
VRDTFFPEKIPYIINLGMGGEAIAIYRYDFFCDFRIVVKLSIKIFFISKIPWQIFVPLLSLRNYSDIISKFNDLSLLIYFMFVQVQLQVKFWRRIKIFTKLYMLCKKKPKFNFFYLRLLVSQTKKFRKL